MAQAQYQIYVLGQLGPQWHDRFEGLPLSTTDNGQTILAGPLPDQAALDRMLLKLGDLGFPLFGVSRITVDDPEMERLPERGARGELRFPTGEQLARVASAPIGQAGK